MKKYDTFQLPLIWDEKDSAPWKLQCRLDSLRYALDYIYHFFNTYDGDDCDFHTFFKKYSISCKSKYVDACNKIEIKKLINLLLLDSELAFKYDQQE